jgi:Fe-S oxidoreductase
MNGFVMGLLLVVTLGAFAYSARRRWRLMHIGTGGPRIDRLADRTKLALRMAIGQQRLGRYPLAGFAHKAIFFGFLVLLLRSVILVGRGFVSDGGFGFWILDSGTIAGNLYLLVKDIYIVLVIVGVLVFAYLRLVKRPKRMTLSGEGMVVLGIIFVMMFADVLYDAGAHVLDARAAGAAGTPGAPAHGGFDVWSPLGSMVAPALGGMSDSFVRLLWHAGFWIHIGLVLAFLNLLPYSKHFHIITAVPNVFLQDLGPAGRLTPIEDLEGKVEREETLGVRRIDQLGWKGILDLYTCTECGRCTDHCPAARTGKVLSPKDLTLSLRDFLYEHEDALVAGKGRRTDEQGEDAAAHRVDLSPAVINEEALWACTTCRACEQECPVGISYVDKIIDFRRYLAQEKGECPSPLQEMFESVEVAGNPYSAPVDERMKWTDGLNVPLRADVGGVDVLFWVGCAPAIDQRARGIARAVAQLLNEAGVSWAILGLEEKCTGDAARRAGNEYLFQEMARANIEVLNKYVTKTIVTACPHCYNTLKNEYPDFGGDYEVVHHADYLAKLVREGRLTPIGAVNARIVYHDSCYLGRYNDIYESPREVLASIPGVELVEAQASRDRGTCCGAGGAQMFKEEEPGDERINTLRLRQLRETGAEMVCTACPFCLSMLTSAGSDEAAGSAGSAGSSDATELDIAEVLWRSVKGTAAPSGDKERVTDAAITEA